MPLFLGEMFPLYCRESTTIFRIFSISFEILLNFPFYCLESTHYLQDFLHQFWNIGDLLYIVYHLSHHYTIKMCHLPAFQEILGFGFGKQPSIPNIFHLPTSSLIFHGDARHISISNSRGLNFCISIYKPITIPPDYTSHQLTHKVHVEMNQSMSNPGCQRNTQGHSSLDLTVYTPSYFNKVELSISGVSR